MPREERINELLKERLANLISREIPMESGLITVVYVKTSPDLRYAKIVVSILPENHAGSALAQLRKHNSFFNQEIKKTARLRKVPKFHWVIDTTEKEAAKIEEIFKEIEEEEF